MAINFQSGYNRKSKTFTLGIDRTDIGAADDVNIHECGDPEEFEYFRSNLLLRYTVITTAALANLIFDLKAEACVSPEVEAFLAEEEAA